MNLVAELGRLVGDEHVLTHQHQLRTYESDGLLQYAVVPSAVVLPGTAGEVAEVVRACHRTGTPFVARGAGSGLSGGALPVEDGVLIALTRLRRILEVDLANQRVTVEPGVTNVAVSHAVGPAHFFPPDPSSQIVCTIGGNVAENSGGAHCFKYGFTTNYVTGLEVVLADGEVVQLGGKELDRPGYDLVGTFVGSEGTLGVATRIVLRVVPKPESVRTLVAFFDSTSQAGEVVSAIVARGIIPGAIEMMDNLSIQAAEPAVGAGYPLDAGAALVVEIDGAIGGVLRPLRRGGLDLPRRRRDRRSRGGRRGRARADLAHAQGRLRGDGPYLAQLLRAGRRDPADPAAPGAGAGSRSCRPSTACGWPTSSTRATATCTRSSVTTARWRVSPSGRRSWPA